jgi:thioredoxin reductase
MAAAPSRAHRYLVVGAGPGGLQIAYFLHQAGADYLVLEREDSPGGFFRHYPRHRRLISLNKTRCGTADPEIALRWDWNSLLSDSPEFRFGDYSDDYYPHADTMVRYLADFQRRNQLNVRFGTAVQRITKTPAGFTVHTPGQLWQAECVIIATGWGRPYIPRIPGIELAVGYEDIPATGQPFDNQRVLIVGKGNSAFETAHKLLGHAEIVHLASPHPLRLSWTTKHPGDVRGQYGALLDSYWFKTLHGVLECEIEQIWRDSDRFKAQITYTLAEGERALLEYDAVIRCTGFAMSTGIFDPSCCPLTVPDGQIPAVGPDWQSVNVDGLYFAGTLMQGRDRRHASSAFIDGFRYNLRTLARLLQERYAGTALACQLLPARAPDLTAAVLDRVNWSSALWTQFEYLCDVYLVDEAAGAVRQYVDLPEDYAVGRFADEAHCYTVTLRWGRQEYADVFAIRRHPVPEMAHESAFLHPVIRRWRHGELVTELHLLEDLMACWRDPVRHVRPLRAFLDEQLGAAEGNSPVCRIR